MTFVYQKSKQSSKNSKRTNSKKNNSKSKNTKVNSCAFAWMLVYPTSYVCCRVQKVTTLALK